LLREKENSKTLMLMMIRCHLFQVPGGGCCCFKTQEEYVKIIVPALSGEPVGNPEMVAAVEDLKHEIVAQTLAIAQLKTDIEDVKGFKGKLGAGDKVQKVAKA